MVVNISLLELPDEKGVFYVKQNKMSGQFKEQSTLKF